MKRKTRCMICAGLMISLILGSGYYEVTPVEAAGVSSDTEYYQWHRAYTPDDLKKYTDASGNTTDYQGKWVPIVIVACYGDQNNPSMYYWNRNTPAYSFDGDDESYPYMTPVDDTSSTGIYLQNAIKNEQEDSFITKGDMGAMHMYYHGYSTSMRKSYWARENASIGLSADAWSLTSDDVEAYSSDTPERVWGLMNHDTRIGLDLSNVITWKGTEGVPQTKSIHDSETLFEQAWTFTQDRTSGQFLIFNKFGWPFNDYLRGVLSNAYMPTIGAAFAWDWTYGPSEDDRHILMTPKDAAAYTTQWQSTGSGSGYVYIKNDDALREDVLAEYYDAYDEDSSRASFRVYVGEPVTTEQVLKKQTVADGSTLKVGYGNVLKSESTIEVQEGGTLIVPESSLFYLDGTIYLNGGTMIVEKNACITSEESTQVRQTDQDIGTGYKGRIECYNGGKLVIQDGAKVYLDQGLQMETGTCVNNGILALNQLLYLSDSRLQIQQNGYLSLGFSYGKMSQFFMLETQHASGNLYTDENKCNYRPGVMQLNVDNSKVILQGKKVSDRIEMSTLEYEFLKQTSDSQLDSFLDSCVLFADSNDPSEMTGWELVTGKSGDSGKSSSNKTVGIRTDYKSEGTYTSISVGENLLKKGYVVLKEK